MTKPKIMIIVGFAALLIAVALVATTWNNNPTENTNTETPTPDVTENNETATPTASDQTTTPTSTSTTTSPTPTTTNPSASPTPTSTNTPTDLGTADYASYIVTSSASSTTVTQMLNSNQKSHEATEDYTYSSSDIITITLNGNSITTSNAACVTISGTTATINVAGTYLVSGTLTDGQVIVNAPDEATVRIILSGINIASATDAPIYVQNADKVIIILSANTVNTVTDNAVNQNKAAIYCKTDLTITGDGSLTVTGNANDAIRSSDGLIINSGTIKVTSVDDGIIGKDYIIVKNGLITVNSGGDCLKADNDENTTRGYIYISGGTINLTTAGGDGISAETDLLITGGNITVTSGGGSSIAKNDAVSTKGLKGQVCVVIDNGNFTINSSDDAVHSNGTIVLNNGNYNIATSDDAVHADAYLEVNGGAFSITKCFEGLESASLTINNGYIQIDSSDDGLNAAGGNDGSSTDWFPRQGGMPGQGGFPSTGNYSLTITGGYIYIDADGDGIDINGYIVMSGGVLVINGPVSNNNGAMDYDSTFTLTGGTIIAVGSSGMAMAPSTASTVNSVLINFNQPQPAGKLVNIQTTSGETLLTVSPTKTYQSILFASTELTTGTYSVFTGGTATGNLAHGIYSNGTYNEGTAYANFTVKGAVTTVR